MADPFETHWDNAVQRAEFLALWGKRAWVSGHSWQQLEQMLLANVLALSELEPAHQAPEPDSRETAFVYWLSRCFGEAGEDLMSELIPALTADGPTAEGAAAALTACPPTDDDAIKGQAAWDNPYARQAFLTAASGAPDSLSDALLNTALESADRQTRAAALSVAARDPQRDPSFFRTWYGINSGEPDVCVQCQAVFGGLIRNDAQAEAALPTLLERAETDDDVYKVLQLIALRGLSSQHNALARYAEREPQRGTALIAVDGNPGWLDTLHSLMEYPATADGAAQAWWRMTGVSIPRVPRLSSVDQGTSAGQGELPDAEWARGWLDTHGKSLNNTDRLLFGRALDKRALAGACRHWAGQGSRSLVWQMQLAAGTGTALHADQWLSQRQQRLEQAGLRDDAVVPPEAATADDWEHGHYA
jgi:hypothetical protein